MIVLIMIIVYMIETNPTTQFLLYLEGLNLMDDE